MTMDLKAFLESSECVILDGAMGTELEKHGVSGLCAANILSPGVVETVHNAYFEAGSNVIITNTLTMNRIFIESHLLGIDVFKVNMAGAQLARSAAAGKGYVLGNLSSTGQLLEPYGTYSEKQVMEAFREQATILLEGGVDGFIIETMIDLREAICALRACKLASPLPAIVTIAFETETHGGRTIMGNSAADCAGRLTEEGADAIGANCGSIDPLQMAEIIRIMRNSTRLPVAAEPNAGKPRLQDGATVFDMDATTFAEGAMTCVRAGAKIIGGCCGTSPEHIQSLARILGKSDGQKY